MHSRTRVAFVLHAHLPWVLGALPGTLEERWLLAAVWESYLPLIDAIDRLSADGVAPALTISVSPTLASMLCDARLPERFEDHLDALLEVNGAAIAKNVAPLTAAARFYQDRLNWARRAWRARGGDVLEALCLHHRAGNIELMTTSATHALLPGLAPVPRAAHAQLALGLVGFERLTGIVPRGVWLPECAISDGVDEALAYVGARHTVVDEHALTFASKSAPRGAPIMSSRGVVYLPRHRDATLKVWSKSGGYPGHSSYREFHRDVTDDAHAGRFARGTATGLKYHRVTGHESEPKAPYDAGLAEAQADRDALDFVGYLEAQDRSLVVAAFDAELFGHWWLEGPRFLEQVLRAIDRSRRLLACTLWDVTEATGSLPVAEPAPSSWGKGGFLSPWMGSDNASIWRDVHRAHRAVAERSLALRDGDAPPPVARAITELLLMEASDWPFAIDARSFAQFAADRVAYHRDRCFALLAGETPLGKGSGFMAELSDEEVVETFRRAHLGTP